MTDNSYSIEFKVRDYECDLQGIVNNAVYQNYLEHARHEYIKTIGVDFNELCKQEIFAVVTRVEIDYKKSLKSGDTFIVQLEPERKGRLKMVFHQKIFRADELIIDAYVYAAIIKNNRPIPVDEVFKSV